ncbi:hypothetical protein T03_694 [Trichinella britovi]|uniref:Reverse transcriptase/retrotransposon-derived protein RNase H-like domain-containing protein n=1 Tax=Trichinella britovi TaxID=45882 RepID=A0A0V1CJ33_TRIBR|nr:hypothetical protein T03_694 [Trichinella britovi]
MSIITSLLNCLFKKDAKYHWSTECQSTFDMLKNCFNKKQQSTTKLQILHKRLLSTCGIPPRLENCMP